MRVFHRLWSRRTATPWVRAAVCLLAAAVAWCSAGITFAQCVVYRDSLHWVAGVDTPSFAWSVAVSGGYAFVADFDSGMQVIDVSVPDNPRIVGHVDTPGVGNGVPVAGAYAYVADGWYGFDVIDLHNPRASS
jgi:hypothetical protein